MPAATEAYNGSVMAVFAILTQYRKLLHKALSAVLSVRLPTPASQRNDPLRF